MATLVLPQAVRYLDIWRMLRKSEKCVVDGPHACET